MDNKLDSIAGLLLKERRVELKAKTSADKIKQNLEDNVYINFGRTVKDLRKKNGWTQGQLGELIGLGRTSITNIELGKQKVLLDDIFLFAYVFEIKPDKFFDQIYHR